MEQNIAQLAPLEPPYSEAIAAVLNNYPQQGGYLLKLFRVFANGERFLKKGVPNLLDKESPLTLREREIVILRVCANNQCEYEWGVHVAIFSKAAGLNDCQISETCQAEINVGNWTTDELVLLKVVDELTSVGKLQESTRVEFQSTFPVEKQLEVFSLCGTYQTISYVANHAEMDLEAFAARFPRP